LSASTPDESPDQTPHQAPDRTPDQAHGRTAGHGPAHPEAPPDQPGYDALAELYDRTFPGPWQRPLDRHSVDAFADGLPRGATLLDIGCGTGHVTVELAFRGFNTIGVDPSVNMLHIARKRYPRREWVVGDAHYPADSPVVRAAEPVRGILARFSLIHVPPDEVAAVLESWAAHTEPGCQVLLVFQCLLDPAGPFEELPHPAAPAWRWNPSALAEALARAGFNEQWRVIIQPDTDHPVPECHLCAVRAEKPAVEG
jgi:SAM-dependent methyltransferase